MPPVADICLVLEGTYPYVSGGVSTWVHQVINMYPERTFALFYLGAQKDPAAAYKYQLPKNIVSIEEVYLFDQRPDSTEGTAAPTNEWRPFYAGIRKLCISPPTGTAHDLELLRSMLAHIASHPKVSFDAFWNHRDTWQVVTELYVRYAEDESFLDFFWAMRFLIQPLWPVAKGAE